MRRLTRFVGPAGFALALLFFLLLPFVAVSCQAPQDAGSIEAVYTGGDLALGADPRLTTTGELSAETPEEFAPREELPDPGARLPALVTVALIVAGLWAGLSPVVRARPLVVPGIALAAAGMLLVTQLVARTNLKDGVRELAGTAVTLGGNTFAVTDEVAGGLVGSRVGYGLALGTLVLVLLWSAAVALRRRSRK